MTKELTKDLYTTRDIMNISDLSQIEVCACARLGFLPGTSISNSANSAWIFKAADVEVFLETIEKNKKKG